MNSERCHVITVVVIERKNNKDVKLMDKSIIPDELLADNVKTYVYSLC